MPVFLYIWHKFIQPLIDRWYGKPKLESGKTDGKLTSDQKVSKHIRVHLDANILASKRIEFIIAELVIGLIIVSLLVSLSSCFM